MSSTSDAAPSSTGTGDSTIGDPSGTSGTGDPTETTEAPTSSSTGSPVPSCGDGNVDPGEECDDGPDNGDGNACTSECTHNVCPADTPIAVLSRAPAGEGAAAAPDAAIAVNFACSVDRATVNDDTIRVYGSHSGRRAFTVEWDDGAGATLALDRPLFHGERVDVTLTAGVGDVSGGHLSPQVFHFTVSSAPGTATYTATDALIGSGIAALGDLDGDGDLDIVRSNGKLQFNEGGGVFTEVAFGPSCERQIVADIDGDHDLDFLCPEVFGDTSIFKNDGTGSFTEEPNNPAFDRIDTFAAADLDGDGDLDLWAVTSFTNVADIIFLNDGTGGFTQHDQGVGSLATYALSLADVDGDGDLDALVGTGNLDEQARIFANDGTGKFAATESAFSQGPHGNYGLELGDVNGDGVADAVILPYFDGSGKIWFGDGAGMFSPADGGLSNPRVLGALARDLDGDGDLDIISANDDFFVERNHVRLNDGAGSFTAGPAFGSGGEGIAVGDVNGDGIVDVIVEGTLFTGG